MDEAGTDGGWAFVAETDGAAALLETIGTLEPGQPYTRSELAEAAGVAMKTLYLAETVERLADLGVLRRVEGDDDQTRYELAPESPVSEAAARFEAAVAEAQASVADAQAPEAIE
jgi:predicted transcriptional regulator